MTFSSCCTVHSTPACRQRLSAFLGITEEALVSKLASQGDLDHNVIHVNALQFSALVSTQHEDDAWRLKQRKLMIAIGVVALYQALQPLVQLTQVAMWRDLQPQHVALCACSVISRLAMFTYVPWMYVFVCQCVSGVQAVRLSLVIMTRMLHVAGS